MPLPPPDGNAGSSLYINSTCRLQLSPRPRGKICASVLYVQISVSTVCSMAPCNRRPPVNSMWIFQGTIFFFVLKVWIVEYLTRHFSGPRMHDLDFNTFLEYFAFPLISKITILEVCLSFFPPGFLWSSAMNRGTEPDLEKQRPLPAVRH